MQNLLREYNTQVLEIRYTRSINENFRDQNRLNQL